MRIHHWHSLKLTTLSLWALKFLLRFHVVVSVIQNWMKLKARTPPSEFPMILGHQVIGYVHATGENASRFKKGDRVGVAWIFSACGNCEFCRKGMENLCPEFKGTGRDARGGYAEYMKVHEKFAYAIPKTFSDAEAAPLVVCWCYRLSIP